MLSAKQAECIRLMMKDPKMSGKDLAAALKVSEKTISQWKNHNTAFQNEYNAHIRRKIQYAAAQAQEKEIELLESDNAMVAYLASKDILDRAGFNPVKKIEQDVDMELDISVDYGDDAP